MADLQSESLLTIVQALGLFYLKITGPYWNLVTENKVPYIKLCEEMSSLHTCLKQLEEDPVDILQTQNHWSGEDTNDLSAVSFRNILSEALSCTKDTNQDILFETVKIVAGAMKKNIERQCEDFILGGKYSDTPSASELKRKEFAHSTNLACEHHFGHLDSSQRRRPHATLHHHSSVHLI